MLLNSSSIASSETFKTQCMAFDQIALQLALAKNNMHAPIKLDEIQLILGTKKVDTSTTITSYSWIHTNRVLLVTINNNDISDKMLTGDDDGSLISKKMEQIYSNLKSATSIWSIKEIQNRLGPPGHVTNKKLDNYSWNCGSGSLIITTNENSKIVSATISYRSSLDSIESRIGPNHPEWDIKTDSLGQSYYAWQRYFAIL